MKLKDILCKLGHESDCQDEVIGVSIDSRTLQQGELFLAMKGLHHDGNDYVEEALSAGAVAVFSDSRQGDKIYRIDNLLEHRNFIANLVYHFPQDHLFLIGITGTNGKTSTSYCLYQALQELGRHPFLIGTNGAMMKDFHEPLENTTPDGVTLARLMHLALKSGCDSIIMEVSSHSLSLQRVSELRFDMTIFTNISHEHLDYHKTLEAYADAKSELFALTKPEGFSIINREDRFSHRMINKASGKVLTFGFENGDYRLKIIELSIDKTKFTINDCTISMNLISSFNVSNVACCFIALKSMGYSQTEIIPVIAKLKPADGRLENVYQKQYSVFVDFAHTPDAMTKVLQFIRPICKGRLITVFGCGGNRDKTKRPMMGRIAQELSDIVIVTSDNPRYEDATAIMDNIIAGMGHHQNLFSYVNREEAICQAMAIAKSGDVIMVLGKGNEEYQIIGDKKLPYNDREAILKCRKW